MTVDAAALAVDEPTRAICARISEVRALFRRATNPEDEARLAAEYDRLVDELPEDWRRDFRGRLRQRCDYFG